MYPETPDSMYSSSSSQGTGGVVRVVQRGWSEESGLGSLEYLDLDSLGGSPPGSQPSPQAPVPPQRQLCHCVNDSLCILCRPDSRTCRPPAYHSPGSSRQPEYTDWDIDFTCFPQQSKKTPIERLQSSYQQPSSSRQTQATPPDPWNVRVLGSPSPSSALTRTSSCPKCRVTLYDDKPCANCDQEKRVPVVEVKDEDDVTVYVPSGISYLK